MPLLAALLAAAPALADAGPIDQIATTRGHTSLVGYAAEYPPQGVATAVEVRLYGHHATFRQVVQFDRGGNIELRVRSGHSAPQPALEGWTPGAFPAFYSDSGGLPVPVVAHGALAWAVDVVGDGPHTVAWTVPYAGDNWAGVWPFDCSCGEPVGMHLEHTTLSIDTGELGDLAMSRDVPITIQNHTAATVSLFDGHTAVAGLAPGEVWQGRTSGGVLTASFLDDWTPGRSIAEGPDGGGMWKSRLAGACHIAGTGWEDPLEPGEVPRRAACRVVRDDKVEGWTVPIAPWRRPGTDPWSGDWEALAAEIYLEQTSTPPPVDFAQWPMLKDGAVLEHGGRVWRRVAAEVTVDAATPSLGEGYAATRLVDADPTTAWCEGVAGSGVGAILHLSLPDPVNRVLVGMVPGLTRTDALYRANAAPRVIEVRQSGRDETHTWSLPLAPTAALYREGQAMELFLVRVRPTTALDLTVSRVRGGSRFDDMCVGEVVVFVEE